MLTLRLTQFTEAKDKYRVEVALESDDQPRQTATSRFDFKLTPQDHEDLRWYLEDFLEQPYEAEQKIAARIEKRMAEIGMELFKAVFQANDDARDLWAKLRDKLDDTRVEISTGVTEATAIPWELLRDPKTEAALALRAQAFVRSQPQAAQRPQLPGKNSGPIRILLVICRPAGRKDVPFRSVASFLIKGLSASAPRPFNWTSCGHRPLSSSARPCTAPKPAASRITSCILTAMAISSTWRNCLPIGKTRPKKRSCSFWLLWLISILTVFSSSPQSTNAT